MKLIPIGKIFMLIGMMSLQNKIFVGGDIVILAAAVKFHIEATGEEVVLCGRRHGDVFAQLKSLGFKPRKGYKELEQGFIDHKGNFLTREEAWEHAKMCGQLSADTIRRWEEISNLSKEMYSEDLW